MKGKIAACLSGYPKGLPSDIGAHLSAEKTKRLFEQGAIGTLTIRTLEQEKQMPWARVISSSDERSVRWANADGTPYDAAPNVRASATLDRAAANTLFAGTGRTLDDILAEADRKGGTPRGFALNKRATISRTATLSPFSSPNVIGMFPGSDPALANEYVLVMDHLDHIGMRKGEDGDLINNGAMDNAGGIASMLEAARAMAASPNHPRRPVL
ncbi:MAG: M28 family peptidase, partial [Chakrabartia sp.]